MPTVCTVRIRVFGPASGRGAAQKSARRTSSAQGLGGLSSAKATAWGRADGAVLPQSVGEACTPKTTLAEGGAALTQQWQRSPQVPCVPPAESAASFGSAQQAPFMPWAW